MLFVGQVHVKGQPALARQQACEIPNGRVLQGNAASPGTRHARTKASIAADCFWNQMLLRCSLVAEGFGARMLTHTKGLTPGMGQALISCAQGRQHQVQGLSAASRKFACRENMSQPSNHTFAHQLHGQDRARHLFCRHAWLTDHRLPRPKKTDHKAPKI